MAAPTGGSTHRLTEQREKVQARLEEVGYDPDRYRLIGYTLRHALILPKESRWFSVLLLDTGEEVLALADRAAALEAFTAIADRDHGSATHE